VSWIAVSVFMLHKCIVCTWVVSDCVHMSVYGDRVLCNIFKIRQFMYKRSITTSAALQSQLNVYSALFLLI